MDQDFLLSLPNDPNDAFVLYEKYVKEHHTTGSENAWEGTSFDKEPYICDIIGFCKTHDIDLRIPDDIPVDQDEFDCYMRQAENKIRIYVSMSLADAAKKKKSGVSPVYVITPVIKKEIHHYIQQIREKLEDTDIRVDKKDKLLNRLNAFAVELDRYRTGGEALSSAFILSIKTVADGAKEFEPVLGLIQKIYKVMGKAKEEAPMLPSVASKKQIEYHESPEQNKVSEDVSNNEIPF